VFDSTSIFLSFCFALKILNPGWLGHGYSFSLPKYNDAVAIAHRALANSKVCQLAMEGGGKTILGLCEEGGK